MLFNSIEFASIFAGRFLSVLVCSQVENLRAQNVFLLVASYFFYGWWDWRFLSLIAFSSSVDYLVGLGFGKTKK
jgi:alginate O-acetyltransferase complex protein AlgI